MTTHADFGDFLRVLEERHVECMIVGGFAVASRGFPRFTRDIDVFVADTPETAVERGAARITFAVQADMAPTALFQRPDSLRSIGLEPVRTDLVNRIAGVAFSDGRTHAVRGRCGAVAVRPIGKDDELRNRRATDRQRNLGDVEELS